MPSSLIVICHVHSVRCGRNSILSFFVSLFAVFLMFSSSFAFVVVPSNASFALALAVLVLLKLLNSFCNFFFLLFFSSFFLFLLLPSVRPLLFFSYNESMCWYVFHTHYKICVFFLFHLPRIIYCFRCNFILFAVRLCFFIFTINIIGFCCCCCRSFHECCVWISGVCVCFFPHLFNQNAYFALHRQQFIFFSCKKKVFARFISLFPLYTIDDSSIAAFVPRSSLTCYECERTKQRLTN